MSRTMKFLEQPTVETREAVAKGDGDHPVFKDEHCEIFAEVLNGTVVGFHAKNAEGHLSKGIHFTETDPSSDIHAQRPTHCWECFFVGGGYYCYPVPCRY